MQHLPQDTLALIFQCVPAIPNFGRFLRVCKHWNETLNKCSDCWEYGIKLQYKQFQKCDQFFTNYSAILPRVFASNCNSDFFEYWLPNFENLKVLHLDNVMKLAPSLIFQYIAKHCSSHLQKLSICYNNWNSDDRYSKGQSTDNFSMVGENLSKLTQLQELDLSRNYIPNEGLEQIAIGLSALSSLTKLNLSGNCISDLGALHVLVNLPQLKDLNLSCNNIFTLEPLNTLVFPALTKLQVLDLNLNDALDTTINKVDNLSKLVSLKRLNVLNIGNASEIVPLLTTLTELEELHLYAGHKKGNCGRLLTHAAVKLPKLKYLQSDLPNLYSSKLRQKKPNLKIKIKGDF